MRNVTQRAVIAAAVVIAFFPMSTFAGTVTILDVQKGEDVFSYVKRVKGGFDQTLYRQVIGAANPYKEGDEAIGVAAGDDASRQNARALLANTKVGALHDNPLFVDNQQKLIWATTDEQAVQEGQGLDHGSAQGVHPDLLGARDQGDDGRPEQRRDRLRDQDLQQ